MNLLRSTIFLPLVLIGLNANADDSRNELILDALATEFSNATYEHSGERLVDSLVSKGLDQSDSDKIIQQFAEASAKCILEGIRVYSERHSLEFGDQLDELESAVDDDSIGNYLSTLEQQEFGSIVAPCMYDAGQAAGLDLGPAAP